MVEYFKPFEQDVKIPSVGEDGEVKYTIVSKELFNEAILKGYMSNGPKDTKIN